MKPSTRIRIKLLLLVPLWIGLGLIAAGFDIAMMRGMFPRNYEDAAWARNRCAQYMGINMVAGPISLLLSPFMTGFYQYGWTLTCKPVERP